MTQPTFPSDIKDGEKRRIAKFISKVDVAFDTLCLQYLGRKKVYFVFIYFISFSALFLTILCRMNSMIEFCSTLRGKLISFWKLKDLILLLCLITVSLFFNIKCNNFLLFNKDIEHPPSSIAVVRENLEVLKVYLIYIFSSLLLNVCKLIIFYLTTNFRLCL